MKHLKSGKISANKDGQGVWEIDRSELTRVYKVRGKIEGLDQSNLATPNNPINSNENILLQVKLDAAMETIERLEADKADWKQQAQSLARLMPPDGAGEAPKRSLWARIRGS
ncbi:putative site-specific recombinase [Sulfitobacter donghicola DSW-25 = KCTC 12864 = JCM 14565]|nr:putative site-specific recombinase [Sulfitobacter donghicola DSW-25 = KCTC 12864 = JCM 14565]